MKIKIFQTVKKREYLCIIYAIVAIFFHLSLKYDLYAEQNVNCLFKDGTATFGSNLILKQLWSSDELNSGNKTISKYFKKDFIFPDYDETIEKNIKNRIHNCNKSIRYISPYRDQKLVTLTFDLCEGEKEYSSYDENIINYLRKNKIKATIFAGGKWMFTHQEKAMQLIADPLFEIGNHSWNHPNFRLINEKEIYKQILMTQDQYVKLRNLIIIRAKNIGTTGSEIDKIPNRINVFRFPYGACNKEALDIVDKLNLASIQWNIVTADSDKNQTIEGIKNIVINRIKPGSIIIMHANGKGPNTAKALTEIVPKLTEVGYVFVTVSELLQAGIVYAVDTCYEERLNDNLRYDKIK